ncbi:unnamed protein product [Blepharisma stoltei]|uniref:Uncharacterized protein n=1 Tax=Blepharisma stoltei TaxID=1481888 RepID=A0AAU9JR39_9CILI|nr:unnamed protein product [Blepharisma stoltei]
MINLLLRDGQILTNNHRRPSSRQSLVPPPMNNFPNSENSRLGDDLPSFSVGIRYVKRKIKSDCPSDILTNSNRDDKFEENNAADFQNPTVICWSRNNSISINPQECSKSPTEEIRLMPFKRQKISFLKKLRNKNKLYLHDEYRSKTPSHKRSRYINSDVENIRLKTPEFFKKALAKISPNTKYQDSKWVLDAKGSNKKKSICSAKFMSLF